MPNPHAAPNPPRPDAIAANIIRSSGARDYFVSVLPHPTVADILR